MSSHPARWMAYLAGVWAAFAPLAVAEEPPTKEPCFTFQADYLLWFLDRDQSFANLAVVRDAGGSLVPAFDSKLGSSDPRSGLRLSAALMSCEGYGVEVSGFLLERAVTDREVNPAIVFGQDFLARPFVDSTTGVQGLSVLNEGLTTAGSIVVSDQTRLWGAEANAVARVGWGPLETVFAGYRYLTLHDRLTITDRATTQTGGLGFFGGQAVNEEDTRVSTGRFETNNDFHGAQVGARVAARSGAFDVSLRSTLAVGVTQQTLDINGFTVLEPALGAQATLPGALLALPSNSGSQSRARFAVVPEVDVAVGVQLAPWARVAVGYTVLYCSAVVRPGDQLDANTNPDAEVPSSPLYVADVPVDSPRPKFRETDFWAQGLNLSLAFSY